MAAPRRLRACKRTDLGGGQNLAVHNGSHARVAEPRVDAEAGPARRAEADRRRLAQERESRAAQVTQQRRRHQQLQARREDARLEQHHFVLHRPNAQVGDEERRERARHLELLLPLKAVGNDGYVAAAAAAYLVAAAAV